MPLYEYKCRQCGETFEVLQKFSDPQLQEHIACGGAVERLISASSFQLKGTGWYVTDYAKGKGKGPNGKNGSSAKSETPAPKPAESKPAPASDSSPKP